VHLEHYFSKRKRKEIKILYSELERIKFNFVN